MRPILVLAVLFLLVGVAGSQPAEARTWNVPSPATPTIAAGIDSAFTGDTIVVAAGTYYEFGLEMSQGYVVLMGATGDPADVVIDAQYIDRVLNISETAGIVIRNMTFRHGFADPYMQESGGALLLEVHAEALIENCVFEEDSAGTGGAAACLSHCTGTFRKCTFRGNGAEFNGGALYASMAFVTVDSCLFELNFAGGYGGGLACGTCSLFVSGSRFSNNTSGLAGGGIVIEYSYMALDDCRFEENQAGLLGGGLYSDTCTVVADDPFFTQNAAQSGGGVYLRNSDGTLRGGGFTHNYADGGEGGGAIVLDGSNPTISNVNFWHNTSRSSGGGAMAILDCAALVDSCSFRWNVVDSTSGGAAFIDGRGSDHSPTFSRCLFANNQAVGSAAVEVVNGAYLNLTSCTVAENDPGDTQEVALTCRESAYLELNHCIVAFPVQGNALFCDEESSVYVSCTDIYGHSSDWIGALAPFDSVNGNFRADPMFCGPEASPYRPYMLQGASPCANDTCGLIGAEPVGCGFVKDWSGLGDGLNWEDEENWNPVGVPGPSDDVRLAMQGMGGVYLSSPASVFRLTVGGPGSAPTLFVTSGTLEVLRDGRNYSDIEVQEGATLLLPTGVPFTNFPGAHFRFAGGDLLGDGLFVNGGNAWKAGAALTSRIACDFENRVDDPGNGAVHIEEGVLEVSDFLSNSSLVLVYSGAVMLLDPGDGPLRTDIIVNNGYVLVESGAAIELHQPTTVFLNMEAGTVELRGGDITGAGTFRNDGLVRKTDESPFTRALSRIAAAFENLSDDPGDGAVRVEEGILAVEEVFDNAGSLYVQTGAELQLDPGEGPLRADFLTNTNVVIVEDGSVLTIEGPATILKNAFGGVVRLQGTGQILGTGALHNYGLFVKEDPTKSRAVGHVTAVFENFTSDPGDGAIHVDDGTLWVEGEFTNSGSVIVHDAAAMLLDPGEGPLRGDAAATNFEGGEWAVAGMLTVAEGASLTNFGLVSMESAASIVNQGLFDHRENAVLAGPGTFDNVIGTFTGGGVIRPGGSVGTLSFIGDFAQTATGEIEVEIGGTAPGTEHDRLAITGSATLGGALYVTLVNEFEPMESDSFAVITSGGVLARTSFDCYSGLDAPGDLFLEPVEETNLFALVARDSTSGNGAPEAADDGDSTDAATPITIRVLANDLDPEMQALRIAQVWTGGTSGAVTVLPGDSLLLYTPVRSFSGQDAFSYAVTDCYGGTDVATVTIGVARAPRSWLVPAAAPTITAGLDSAWAKDTVVVASGTYHEHDLAMKSGVVLRSEAMNPASVVIDADSLGRVLSCTGMDSTTAVIGITFMGGHSANGGGAYVSHSDMTFDRCVFRGNYASSVGGGLDIDNSDPVIRRCAFEGNAAFAAAGAISLDSSNAIIESCLVVSNRVAYNGAAFFIRFYAPAFRSCTFAGNVATDGMSGSIFYVIAAHPTLENTIVCSNTGAKTATCASGGMISLSCCDVYGNSGGNYVGCFTGQGSINNNFSADPQFCQFGNPGDRFALMPTSPCAPANNPSCGLVGARPVGCGVVTGVADAPPPAYEYRLFANRPNPFNPTTTLRFTLPRAERATLVVYDIAGRRVATLADGVFGPGEFDATWNGTDASGRDVASGIYFARLAAGEFTAVRKMVLLR